MTLTPEDLARLEAVTNAATPGPWMVALRTYGDSDIGTPPTWPTDVEAGEKPDEVSITDGTHELFHDPDTTAKNSRFVVLARTAMPLLLARVRELEEDLASVNVIARDLTEALNDVLGTESDDPGFEEKWDRAEVSGRLAQQVFGMTKKEGTT